MSAKENIKNKLSGDELDLSMSRLTNIPVEDIASITKATKLDLSNNEIVHIPHNFATCLPHITKIDLSSNKLRELPNNFGSLINLKHLDLYNNQLTDLPLCVSSLQNLRYLDLKNNPLRVDLAKAAGNCLDNKECHLAAKRIISHLRTLKSEKNREFALAALKDKRENMAKQKQEEEERVKENEKRKLEKKVQKEKRRQEHEDLKRRQLQQQQQQQSQQQQQQSRSNQIENSQNGKAKRKEFEKAASQNRESKRGHNKNSDKWSCLGLVNWLLVLAVSVCAVALFVISSEGNFSEKGLKMAWSRSLNNSYILLEITKETVTVENFQWMMENTWTVIGPCAVKVQEALLMGLSATRNLASASFQVLQSVTGDLNPYFDGLIPYWDSFQENFWWLLSKIDLTFMLEGVVWFFRFMYMQVQVLNEEFWNNEAIVSIWRDMKPLREFLWSNTVTFRYYSWYLCEELTVTWWPALKQSALDLYDCGREKLEALLL